MMGDGSVTPQEFDYLRGLVRERSGTVIEPDKRYLAELRLGPVAQRLGFGNIRDLLQRLRGTSWGPQHQAAVEAMLIGETSFFRDVKPFEVLRSAVLPALIERRQSARVLNIWCAACSTGQEPYTVAMVIDSAFQGLGSWTVRILATDLSREALDRARGGQFGQIEVNRGLPAPFLVRYFRQERGGWRISERIQAMVEFRPLNLVEPWPSVGPQDVIFLRNVLIYYDPGTRAAVLDRVRRNLQPDGYLFLGAAEATMSLDASFEPLAQAQGGCFRPRRGATA